MDGTQPALLLACRQPADRQWRTRHSCAQARTRSTFPLVLRRCHSLGALAWPRVGGPFVLAAWGPTLLHRVVATPVLAQREPSRPTAAEVRANAAAEVLRCVALGGENELRALAAGAGLSPAALAAALAAPGLEAGGAGSTPAAFPGGSAAPAPAQPATLSRPRRRVRAA